MPQHRKLTRELNLSQPSSKSSCWDHQACLLRTRNQTQLQEYVPHFPAVWCVFSVRALGFDAGFTPGTEMTMRGFTGPTLLFRGLVSEVILTMDISLNSSLSFVILLCLAQSSFPILFANDRKTDSRIVFKLLPLIVDIDSIIDVHVQHVGAPLSYTMSNPGVLAMICFTFSMQFLSIDNFTLSIWSEHNHRAIAAAFVHRQSARFVSVTSKLTFMLLPDLLVKGTLRLMP